MLSQLQATYLVMKKWSQNSDASKSEIGIWQHWQTELEENDRPLTQVEVAVMKAFLKRNAPTSYFKIFEPAH